MALSDKQRSIEGATDSTESSDLDYLMENISRIMEEEDSKVFSREVIAEFRSPHNPNRMADADGAGVADGLCGDTMEIFIKVDGSRIVKCAFFTDGCGATVASGSRLARFVEGMTVGEASAVKPIDLVSLLGGLPEGHEHCAALAVIALRNALRDVEERRGPGE